MGPQSEQTQYWYWLGLTKLKGTVWALALYWVLSILLCTNAKPSFSLLTVRNLLLVFVFCDWKLNIFLGFGLLPPQQKSLFLYFLKKQTINCLVEKVITRSLQDGKVQKSLGPMLHISILFDQKWKHTLLFKNHQTSNIQSTAGLTLSAKKQKLKILNGCRSYHSAGQPLTTLHLRMKRTAACTVRQPLFKTSLQRDSRVSTWHLVSVVVFPLIQYWCQPRPLNRPSTDVRAALQR